MGALTPRLNLPRNTGIPIRGILQAGNHDLPSASSELPQLGRTGSPVSDENPTQQASLTQHKTQQNTESSVSLEQHIASLKQQERSYAAAAKVFTIVEELLASAPNLGEPATLPLTVSPTGPQPRKRRATGGLFD